MPSLPAKLRKQNDPRPLYFRSPRSNLYLSKFPGVDVVVRNVELWKGIWYTGFGVGLLGITYGATQLIRVRVLIYVSACVGYSRSIACYRERRQSNGGLLNIVTSQHNHNEPGRPVISSLPHAQIRTTFNCILDLRQMSSSNSEQRSVILYST